MIITKKIIWLFSTSIIILSSIYLSFILKFPQLKIKTIIKSLKPNNNHKSLNSFQLLMINLAGKIGVGSIAGVAISIYIGGIGSIFWIWVITILSAVLTYGETILGIKYRKKVEENIYGGPCYYIKYGLNNKNLGYLYAIIIILSYIGGFIGIQSNTIAKSIIEYIDISPLLIGILLSITVYLIIKNGVSKIAAVSSKMVPFMILIYLISGLIIISCNAQQILSIFLNIIKSSFTIKGVSCGVLTSFMVGIQRGIFATESGLGTSSIASSISTNEPKKEAYIQILGIYITSFLICTVTAFVIIIMKGQTLTTSDLNGIEIIKHVFYLGLGRIGNLVILISIILFAFSTIITGYYYGEVAFQFFIHKKRKTIILKIITIINILVGCILPSTFIWNLVDILVAILSIINIYAILQLKDDIIKESKK